MQGGKWIKQKHDEKQKGRGKKKHIRRRILKLPRANSAYYTSHLIMWRGLFGDGCLSAAVTGITMMAGLVFLLLTETKTHRNLFDPLPVTTHTRSHVKETSDVRTSPLS